MKANEFVKKFGWEKAKEALGFVPENQHWFSMVMVKENGYLAVMQAPSVIHQDGNTTLTAPSFKLCDEWKPKFTEMNKLKTLVESHDLVERVISDHNKSFKECQIDIHGLKSLVKKNPKIYPNRLKQAIADVESCQ